MREGNERKCWVVRDAFKDARVGGCSGELDPDIINYKQLGALNTTELWLLIEPGVLSGDIRQVERCSPFRVWSWRLLGRGAVRKSLLLR